MIRLKSGELIKILQCGRSSRKRTKSSSRHTREDEKKYRPRKRQLEESEICFHELQSKIMTPTYLPTYIHCVCIYVSTDSKYTF